MPSFNEKLQTEVCCTGAFDNYQKVNIKKEAVKGKNAITHRGTAYLLKKDRPYELPANTQMVSTGGLKFTVTSCKHSSD